MCTRNWLVCESRHGSKITGFVGSRLSDDRLHPVDDLQVMLGELVGRVAEVQVAMRPLAHHGQLMWHMQRAQSASELHVIVDERIFEEQTKRYWVSSMSNLPRAHG